MSLDEETLAAVERLAPEVDALQHERKASLETWAGLSAVGQGQTAGAGQRLYENVTRAGWAIRKAELRITELLDGVARAAAC